MQPWEKALATHAGDGVGTGTWCAVCLEEVMSEQTLLGIRRRRDGLSPEGEGVRQEEQEGRKAGDRSSAPALGLHLAGDGSLGMF